MLSVSYLRFTLPIHSDRAYDAHEYQSDRPHDPRVVGAVVYDLHALSAQQIVHGVAESDRVHASRHGVGEGEYNSDRSTELWTERSRYDVVNATCCNIDLSYNSLRRS